MVNQQEFLSLVNQNQGIIHKICNLYGHSATDREDLFQEITIQLWRAYPKFRGESKFSTWLYRIALNTAISDFRKQNRQVVTTELDQNLTELAYTPYDYEKEEKLQWLYQAIRELPEIDKAIVILYLEDNSYEEMEAILGINQNNLRVKMNRIKEKLRKQTKASAYGAG